MLLTKQGFDPNDLTKINNNWTPLIYFIINGNVTMVRYLIVCRNADCRQLDRWGYPPMHWAAMYGHLEIIKLLSHDGGAHDDIRKLTRRGYSPLRVALSRRHFHVARWLILNGALASRDDNVMDDIVMRRDLRRYTSVGTRCRNNP